MLIFCSFATASSRVHDTLSLQLIVASVSHSTDLLLF